MDEKDKHTVSIDGLLRALEDTHAFIFDFDGTIADTESVHYLAYCKVLESLGSEFSLEEFKSYVGKERTPVYREIKAKHGLSFDDEEFFRLKTDAFLELSAKLDLSCFTYYSKLRDQFPDVPAFIVSSQDGIVIEHILFRWKIEQAFDAVRTTGEHREKKLIIEDMTKEFRLKPSRTAYFEDSPTNLAMGKTLGLATVGIQTWLNGDVFEVADYALDVRDECYDRSMLTSLFSSNTGSRMIPKQ